MGTMTDRAIDAALIAGLAVALLALLYTVLR